MLLFLELTNKGEAITISTSIKLPVGIENFEEIRTGGYYYVDKTKLIKQLFASGGKVNLFTRPRRFGKTLNMSMLKCFLEIGAKPSLFDGLYISENKQLCSSFMGKYPVVFITLKNVDGLSFEEAKYRFVDVIGSEASRFSFLLDSDRISSNEKEMYKAIISMSEGSFKMNTQVLLRSLKTLSELLYKHYDKKTIILIDEYDVPLDKAFQYGYYKEMVTFIRGLLGDVLKTNDALEFAVLTGCLRVSKESIFTGLNNFKILSITDTRFDEQFGFTDREVKDLLSYYNVEDKFKETKEWYDGYRFENVDIYCPWDVINYCSDHIANQECAPKNYWVNTSGNDVIHRFINSIYEPQKLTKLELEHLVNGGSVQKEISQEMTYKELYSSIDNLWSTLFMTGYLTSRSNTDGNRYDLVIPNREIRNIITEHILKLFKENIKQDGQKVNAFCDALLTEKADVAEKLFSDYMQKTISVRDTFVQKPTKENFYHGILLGILGFKENWLVTSNRESGDGFSDIMIQVGDSEVGIVIEVKYANDGNLEAECKKALKQIDDTGYAEALHQDGICKILKYAIACYKKTCKIMLEAEKC